MLIDKELSDDYNNININTGFNYLINMSINNFTEEKLIELNNTINLLEVNHISLSNKTIKELWLDELKTLKSEYLKLVK
jgi:hypothetical protein